jgi:hypothetical protein
VHCRRLRGFGPPVNGPQRHSTGFGGGGGMLGSGAPRVRPGPSYESAGRRSSRRSPAPTTATACQGFAILAALRYNGFRQSNFRQSPFVRPGAHRESARCAPDLPQFEVRQIVERLIADVEISV